MSRGKLVLAVLWRLGVVALVAFVFGVLPSPTQNSEKSFRINDANVRIEVQRDGALQVTERLVYDFTGRFQGAYRDIPLGNGVALSGVKVQTPGTPPYEPGGNTALGSYDRPGTFGVEELRLPDGSNGVAGARIVWHYNVSDREEVFEVSYRVENAAVAYDDVVDVGWVVWGDQWPFWLDELRAEILPPSGAESISAWVRPRALEATVGVEGDEATMSLERAPEGDVVVFRSLIPRDAFGELSAAQQKPGSGREQVEAEEAALDEDLGTLTKLRNSIAGAAGPLAWIWTAIVLGLTTLLYALARERRSDVPRYLPEPPEDLPPALAYAIASEGEYDDRVVVATLLDLVDRGYYDAAPSEGKDLDLEIEVAAERPDLEPLEPYERTALDFFDDLLDDERVALGKFKDKVPKHSESWRKKWEALNESLDQAEEGELSWDRNLTGPFYLLAFLALLGYGAIIGAFFSRTFQFEPPLVVAVFGILFMFLGPATGLKRLDPAARERHARWGAFRRWTKDFPSLSDDPPATLQLWRSILVYAVAFGTAERIARSGRIPAPVVEDASGWTYAAFHHSTVASSFNGFASSFSGQVAPESSGGGGGGGGGGGFSGGGGGGAW